MSGPPPASEQALPRKSVPAPGPRSAAPVKRDVLAMQIAKDRARAIDNAALAKRNFVLALAALASLLISFSLAVTVPRLHGYISVDDSMRVITPGNLGSHDSVSDAEVFNFAAMVVRRCLNFTYLTQDFMVHDCLERYFTRQGSVEFGDALEQQILPRRKSAKFDLRATVLAAPVELAGERVSFRGKAAWRLLLPIELAFAFRDQDPMIQRFMMTVWVVREYKDLKPEGLAIQSAVLKRGEA